MGEVKAMLFSEPLAEPAPVLYASKRSLEAAETLHHHERNVRLEYTAREFAEMLRAMSRAGKSGLAEIVARTLYLDLSDIPAVPGVTPKRFQIEESTYPTLEETTIHLHYRSLRLEFTHREWAEFAKGVVEAWGVWNQQ